MANKNAAFGGRGVTGGEAMLAVMAALVALVLVAAAANRSRTLTLERRESEDRTIVSAIAVGLSEDLDAATAAVGNAAALASRGGSLEGTPIGSTIPGWAGIGALDADGRPTSAGVPLTANDLEDPQFIALLDRVRDSGTTTVSTATMVEAGPRLLIARALFVPAATGPPANPEERRAQHQGWVVASYDVARSASARLEEGQVASVEMDDVAFTTGALRGGLPVQQLDVQGREARISAGSSSGVAFAGVTVALLVLGVLGAVVFSLGTAAVLRRMRSYRDRANRADAQVHLIAEVAPVVQRSLDLADVLPVVAIQLTDHFGLSGIRLSGTTSATGTVELFRLGRPPVAPPRPVLTPPENLPAGEALSLALQRGGRTVALLDLVAGRELLDVDLQSLRVISELVTAAVVNSSLYSSQQDAVRRLRDLDALKTVFLGTASHELRTPATAIGGFAALLVGNWEKFGDEQRFEFVQRIAANARSLGAVVQDLLDFSLLDRAVQDPLLEPLDLAGLVEGVVERLAPMVEHHTIAYEVEPAPEVFGERNGLERVVTNLLTNAVKFSPPETTVSIAVAPSRDGATITVSDPGSGGPEEERARIFTRFYRGGGPAVVSTRGVGIGLSVVSELVERMHGTVSVGDAPGGGAQFTVWLPPVPSGAAMEQTADRGQEGADAPRA